MKRKITITIEDESGKKFSGTTELGKVNELYAYHKINGINQIVHEINHMLNKANDENMRFLVPNELTTLPEGKEW